MNVTKEAQIQPCEECKKLVGAHRHIEPHPKLVLTQETPVKSMFGSVDEYYYRCRECGKTWLHETGNYGQGWVE